MPTGWWRPLRERGLCPGCRQPHDGGRFYCRACRKVCAERSKESYVRTRAYNQVTRDILNSLGY